MIFSTVFWDIADATCDIAEASYKNPSVTVGGVADSETISSCPFTLKTEMSHGITRINTEMPTGWNELHVNIPEVGGILFNHLLHPWLIPGSGFTG
jgi:hypothetical protein